MANNMFFDSASQRQVTASARGQSRFVVDVCGSGMVENGMDMVKGGEWIY